MAGADAVTATLTAQPFILTVNRAGAGSGTATSSDGLISCPSTCTATYDSGISVTLTASPASGSTFTAWSGCDTVSGATCTVTMTAAKSVSATFNPASQRFTLTVNRAGTGNGTATSSPPGINCGATCSAAYDSGTVVTLAEHCSRGPDGRRDPRGGRRPRLRPAYRLQPLRQRRLDPEPLQRRRAPHPGRDRSRNRRPARDHRGSSRWSDGAAAQRLGAQRHRPSRLAGPPRRRARRQLRHVEPERDQIGRAHV